MLPSWTIATLAVAFSLVVPFWSPVAAQQPSPGVTVTIPAPTPPVPEFRFEPTAPPEQQGTREQDFYPGPVRSRHDPAFLAPFVRTVPVSRTSAARVGLSGWTAPAIPFDIMEASGGVAFGLTVQWGLPVSQSPEASGPGQR